MPIHFFNEAVNFQLKTPDLVVAWLDQVITQEGYATDTINYIFCNDTYLHQINKQHLQHDTLTDIITFDYREEGQSDLLADIYISIERVQANATTFRVTLAEELARVLVHGVLHLVGYDDKTKKLKAAMRKRENLHITSANAKRWLASMIDLDFPPR